MCGRGSKHEPTQPVAPRWLKPVYSGMKRLKQLCLVLPFLAFGCASSPDSAVTEPVAGNAPPTVLMQENCRKAQAIVLGKIIAVRDAQNTYSSALLLIEKSYKGLLRPADTVRYYSFRSEPYDSATTGRTFIVFLVRRPENDQASWGTATDLAEFPANAATERLLRQTLN